MFKSTTQTLCSMHGITKFQQERLPTRLPSVKPIHHMTKALNSIEHRFNRIKEICTAQSQHLFFERLQENQSQEYFAMLEEHDKHAKHHEKSLVTALDDVRNEINRLKDPTDSNKENFSHPLTKSQITAFSTRCLQLKSTIVKYCGGINELIGELYGEPLSDDAGLDFTSQDSDSYSPQRLSM